MNSNRYDQRGVSASKSEVHSAIKDLSRGLYPNAFCKILPDLAGGSSEHCNIMHADTAGTKTSLAYIYWKETGDLSVWEGVVQDAIVMNIDDMACVGCVDNIIISSTIGRNKSKIPGEVLQRVIQASQNFIDHLGDHDVQLTLAGGETADVGDIVRTIDVGITAFGRMKQSDLIKNEIQSGDVIIGLASYGQSTYEDSYNGGMGSNGLTSARHDVFHKKYGLLYPESYDNNIPEHLTYSGSKNLTDLITIDGVGDIPIGQLVLSPTRTYMPVIKTLLDQFQPFIHSMIHCTGGAQTKVLKFVKDMKVVKDNMLEIPPLFRLIEKESGTTRKEMYEVFNMGHRLEIYCPEQVAEAIIKAIEAYNIKCQIIGHVESSSRNELVIKDKKGTYIYL